MRSACLAATLLLLSMPVAHSQKSNRPSFQGQIIGTVIDQDGRPVSHVWVSTNDFQPPSIEPDPTERIDPPQAKPPEQHFTKWLDEDVSWIVEDQGGMTNNEGVFRIRGLAFRGFILRGEKEEDAYPSADLTFADGTPAIITLSPDLSVARVVVRLGQKGGVVSGPITDKQTGRPVRASFSIYRSDNNAQMLSSSARPDFRIVLAAHFEAKVVFSAAGYKRLTMPLRLESGERQALNVEMTPDRKTPTANQPVFEVVPQSAHSSQ